MPMTGIIVIMPLIPVMGMLFLPMHIAVVRSPLQVMIRSFPSMVISFPIMAMTPLRITRTFSVSLQTVIFTLRRQKFLRPVRRYTDGHRSAE